MVIKKIIAQGISFIFHPLIMPTLAFLLLLNSGFYFSLLTYRAKLFILLIIFLSTFVLPLLSIGLMRLNTKFRVDLNKHADRVIPMLSTAVFYYLGYYYLGRLPVYPIYRVFLISSILIIVMLMTVSVRWKISAHMAGIGGIIGAFMALSFRLNTDTSVFLSFLIAIAGLLGTSRLILDKHNPVQVYAGFSAGFLINYMIINYI